MSLVLSRHHTLPALEREFQHLAAAQDQHGQQISKLQRQLAEIDQRLGGVATGGVAGGGDSATRPTDAPLEGPVDLIDDPVEVPLVAGPELAMSGPHVAGVNAGFGQVVLCDPTGGGFTVNLPAAEAQHAGHRIVVKNASGSTNAITVSAAAGQTVDGSASTTITSAYGKLELVCDGSDWWSV